jgi:hypothetical protein
MNTRGIKMLNEILHHQGHDGFWYLASPYTHHDPKIREARANIVKDYMGALLYKGVITYSPIWSCHAISLDFELPMNYEYWLDFNRRWMRHSVGTIVAQLSDYDRSRGVADEIAFTKSVSKPLFYVSLTDGNLLFDKD